MDNRITGHTRLYCLIGSPVGHSGSPAMYNYSFESVGEDGAYLAFDVPLDKLAEGIAAIKTFNVKGFNITMPDKTAVIEYLDEVTPAAQLIGACNTVTVAEDGKMTGHNTDGIGFVRNLQENGVEVKGKKLVVLGTGGAATAICVQAALDGAAEIAIFNPTDAFYENGVKTVERLAKAVPGCHMSMNDIANTENLKNAVDNADILVNATKVGMKPMEKETLIDKLWFRPELVVADTFYNPRETRMIVEAKEAGCKAIGGIGMLLWQGAAAFKLFTGKDMPAEEVMEKFFS